MGNTKLLALCLILLGAFVILTAGCPSSRERAPQADQRLVKLAAADPDWPSAGSLCASG